MTADTGLAFRACGPARRIEEAHKMLRWLGIEPLEPPLYRKTSGGNVVRVHDVGAVEKAYLRKIVYSRDGFACCWCGRQFEQPDDYLGNPIVGLTLGHVVEYRFGGPYVADNLRAECQGCNGAQGVVNHVPQGTPASLG